MQNTERPDLDTIYCACKRYVYSDSDAAQIAAVVYENWEVSSAADIGTRVIDYLSTHKPHAKNWDVLPLHMEAPDPYAERALKHLDPNAQAILRLRTVDGESIAEIAAYAGDLTEALVERILHIGRLKFWSFYVSAEQTTLQICRRYVYKDNIAERTAIAVCRKNLDMPTPEVIQHSVHAHLAATEPYADTWDTLALQLEFLDAATLDTHAQRAFDTLERQQMNFLRLRVAKGYPFKDIAQKYKWTPAKVQEELLDLRLKFWDSYVSDEQTTLRACRRYIYTESIAMQTAIAIRRKSRNASSSGKEIDESVRSYLFSTHVDADAWDSLPVYIQQPDSHVKETLNRLEASHKKLLDLRLVQGDSVEEIAKHLGLTVAVVSDTLSTVRSQLWTAVMAADDAVLKECRRFIHDDTDAASIAAAIYKQGPPEAAHLREYVYEYLINSWDKLPAWNDQRLSDILKEVTDPIHKSLPGIHAATVAYAALPNDEQELLKLTANADTSRPENEQRLLWKIARELNMNQNEAKRKWSKARKDFWRLFISERWSTLPYFIEVMSQSETSDPSREILKVKKEYEAAQSAYDSLGTAEKKLLKKRHRDGISLEKIAADENKSTEWVTDELTRLREQFRLRFQEEVLPQFEDADLLEDDSAAEARKTFISNYYKYVPENSQEWLKITAQRKKNSDRRKEELLNEAARKVGISLPVDDDTDDSGGGTKAIVISGTEEPKNPEDHAVNAEGSEVLLKRSHEFFAEIVEKIKEMKEPEKKLFLLIKYFLNKYLDAHQGEKARFQEVDESQGESQAPAGLPGGAQEWMATAIGKSARTIRRYKDLDIRPALISCCEKESIDFTELERECHAIRSKTSSIDT